MRIKSKLCVKFVWLFIVESKKQHLGADTLLFMSKIFKILSKLIYTIRIGCQVVTNH